MFATIFCGLLNTETGVLSFANGGHNTPFLICGGREVTYLEGKRGLVVGAMEESVYETERINLRFGDALFMYTDGVTEAVNGGGELFSDDRLKRQVIALQGKSIQEMIGGIMEEIHSFSHGAEQYDDIAMLMIRFNGEKG